MDCICPRPAALQTVLRVTCPENLGQIQRVAILRAGGFLFDPDAIAPGPYDIRVLASWTPLLIAADSTKVVITPYLDDFKIPEAQAITKGGGDNTTVDGVERVLGAGPITVTGIFNGVPAAILGQIRDLSCEAALEVYLFNQYGRIVARDTTPATAVAADKVFSGIPIQSLYTPYAGNDGYATEDHATFRFAFAEDWAKNRMIITPNFNLKTQLQAPLV
jgi:hypothetical protein